MGIVNVTPDSFSDGGHHGRPSEAILHGRRLLDAGADLIDVGGESTRPGAMPVDERTEIARVVPVVEALAGATRVSIDTTKPAVARAAVAAGATILNDVSASLAPLAAELGVGWVAMHMQGEPRTMQVAPTYDDVVTEVIAFLTERAEGARALGVDEIWIDPGIGFGKTAEHNWELLRALPALVRTGLPVAVGTSRKAFLGAFSAEVDGAERPTSTDDRLEASVTTALYAAHNGAAIVRVHDVAATVAAFGAVAA